MGVRSDRCAVVVREGEVELRRNPLAGCTRFEVAAAPAAQKAGGVEASYSWVPGGIQDTI